MPCFAIKIGLQTDVTSSAVGTSFKGFIIYDNTNIYFCDLDAMNVY